VKTTNSAEEAMILGSPRTSVTAHLNAYGTLVRIPNCLLIGLAVIVGEAIALGALPSLAAAVFGFLTASLLLAGTMVLNDIHDIEADRVNTPNRPLPSGKIGTQEAYLLSAVLSSLGILFSILLGPLTLLTALLALVLMVYYNTGGKSTGLLGNAVVSFNVALPFFFGGLAVDNLRPLLFIFFVLAFLVNMAREIVKGIVDVAGDSLTRVKTLAVWKGPRSAAWASGTLFVSAVALSFLAPLLDTKVSLLYYPGVILADIGFLYSAYRLVRDQKPETARVVKKQVLVWILLGLVGFLMGGTSLL
jgi:geranylgeranylglycerol-phosphate geranylgeranyltransferase